jgi:polyhydroxyalkanoate synthesis regulator phasin
MGEREDVENERRSRAMVEGVKPVRYWRQRSSLDQLAYRVAHLEERVAELERRLRN